MKIHLPLDYTLRINRNYKSIKPIVPIGYDCHPAYLLNSRTLRKKSLPFDWLLTSPLMAMDYVYFNLKDSFKFFLTDIKKNCDGKNYANKYPTTFFYHNDDLISNKLIQDKLIERSTRLVKLFKKEALYFLFVIPSISLDSYASVQLYVMSIERFLSLIKDTDKLLIYVRFENSLTENEEFCKILVKQVRNFKKIKLATLLLESDQYGLWGNESKYAELLNDLGVEQRQIFPKISFKKDFHN